MILVTGSLGFVGKRLMSTLLERGYSVRCVLPPHQQKQLPNWNPMPEIVFCTMDDEEKLYQAVAGVHVIIHLESAQWWGSEVDLERIELVGTRYLIEAARVARVGRIIMLSHLGATPSSSFVLLRIKGLLEEIVKGSGLAYTILRSGVLFGEEDAFINHLSMVMTLNPLFVLMPGRGEVVLHPIYVDDLLQAMLATLTNLNTVDRVLEIGGAEYISLHDLYRTIMRVSRRYRLILSVPPYTMRFITRLLSIFSRRSLITAQWFDILASNRTAHLGNLFHYFGLRPRRLEDTLLLYLPRKHNLIRAIGYMFRAKPKGSL